MLQVHHRLDTRIQNTNATIERLLDKQNTVVSSTKFGTNSIVFLHLITNIAPNIPIIWVDTGYNSRETLAFVQGATSHLSLNLHTFKPQNHTIQIPPATNDPDHSAFAETVKLAPFKAALKALNATHWISSIRSYQNPNRKALPATVRLSNQLTKVHPMLDWSEEDMQDYRNRYSLPAGPPAYDPTKGESMRECGLHEVGSFF